VKIICEKCENVINRDKYLGEKLVEEYNNIYGTICPNCGNIIKPIKKHNLFEDKELKMEELKEDMRARLRKNIRRP